MKNIATTVLCVLFCIFLIGSCIYPNFTFDRVVSVVNARMNTIASSIKYVNNLVSLQYFDGNYRSAIIADIKENKEFYYDQLKEYIPYHLAKYGLYKRCTTNEFFTVWMEDVKFCVCCDSDVHKNPCCLLQCYMYYDNQKEYFWIIYDAFDDEIVGLYYWIYITGNVLVYPFEPITALAIPEFEKNRPSIANTFYYDEVRAYINGY